MLSASQILCPSATSYKGASCPCAPDALLLSCRTSSLASCSPPCCDLISAACVATCIAQLAPSGLTSLASDAENEVPALWWILAVIMSIITLVYIISMCVARKQIRTAISLVKEGANVIKDR